MSLREKPNEDLIQFEASEDLFDSPKTQVLLFKHSSKILKINTNTPRHFSSLCFEFCGLTGLSYPTLRFRNLNKDVKAETRISSGCHISVGHKIEFSLEPGSSLRACLRSVLQKGSLSDVKIRLNSDKSFELHRSLLACRSGQFSAFFKHFDRDQQDTDNSPNPTSRIACKGGSAVLNRFDTGPIRTKRHTSKNSGLSIAMTLKKSSSGPNMLHVKSREKLKWNVSEIHDLSGEERSQNILSVEEPLDSDDQSIDGLKFREVRDSGQLSMENTPAEISSSDSDGQVTFSSQGGFLRICFKRIVGQSGRTFS